MAILGNVSMGKGNAAIALILIVLLVAPASGMQTKTAYTRDDVHFISKERVEENIRYEYAKPGDYREVQVPLDTIVVGASSIPENISQAEQEERPTEEKNLSSISNKTASAPDKYPYAPLSIGMLIIGGLIFFVASAISGRNRR